MDECRCRLQIITPYTRALTISTTTLISQEHVHGPIGPRGVELTGRLQASTANEEAVNILLLSEVTAVLLADGTAVDDTGVVRGLSGDSLAEPLADGGVDLLGLLCGSDLAGSDSPVTC